MSERSSRSSVPPSETRGEPINGSSGEASSATPRPSGDDVPEESVDRFLKLKAHAHAAIGERLSEWVEEHDDLPDKEKIAMAAVSDVAALLAVTQFVVTKEQFLHFMALSFEWATEVHREREQKAGSTE